MTTRLAGLFILCLCGAGFLTSGIEQAEAADRIAWIEDLGLRAGVPLVWLPAGAGALIGIDEQRKVDSYTQTITFQGDHDTVGENQIVATVTRNGLAPRIEQYDLDNELADRLPDLRMTIGPAGTRNALGIFGTAVGSKGALNCVYGWQRINLADRLLTGENAGPFDEHHALSVRYRLCRTTLNVEQLVALVAGAQAGGSDMQTFVAAPLGMDALTSAAGLGNGLAGAVGYPPQTLTPGLAGPDSPSSRLSRQRRRALRRRVVAAPASQQGDQVKAPSVTPMAGMPNVPLPQ